MSKMTSNSYLSRINITVSSDLNNICVYEIKQYYIMKTTPLLP